MARKVDIINRNKSHAIGMGYVDKTGKVRFAAVFGHTAENDVKVRDLLAILHSNKLYNGGNEQIDLKPSEALDKLILMCSEHGKTLAFLKKMRKKQRLCFIVVMHKKIAAATPLEAELIAEMFRQEKLEPRARKRSGRRASKKK